MIGQEINRVIDVNPLLRDGTPRRERGVRAYVQVALPDDLASDHVRSVIYTSPLLRDAAEAGAWMPPQDVEDVALAGLRVA